MQAGAGSNVQTPAKNVTATIDSTVLRQVLAYCFDAARAKKNEQDWIGVIVVVGGGKGPLGRREGGAMEGGEENGATQAPSVPPRNSQARSSATEERQNRGVLMGKQGTLLSWLLSKTILY